MTNTKDRLRNLAAALVVTGSVLTGCAVPVNSQAKSSTPDFPLATCRVSWLDSGNNYLIEHFKTLAPANATDVETLNVPSDHPSSPRSTISYSIDGVRYSVSFRAYYPSTNCILDSATSTPITR